MSNAYSDNKIKDILTKVNGQGKLAEQAIATLAQRDLPFLHALVQPYLSGIISHAIERARKSTGIKESPIDLLPKKAMTSKSPAPKSAVSNAAVSGNTMDNLMKAWAKGFEQDQPTAPGSAKVSQNHIDVLKSLVKKKK